MPQPPLAPKTSNSHSRPWLQWRSGPQPPLALTISPLALTILPLALTILPLALAAIGQMALLSNLSSTSVDVVVQSDTSAISLLALVAIGQMALVSDCIIPGHRTHTLCMYDKKDCDGKTNGLYYNIS